MRLGLLDRAEGLFLELIESDLHLNQAYTELLEIYQQEKDLGKCDKYCQKTGARLW